jgi:hypothetical protein
MPYFCTGSQKYGGCGQHLGNYFYDVFVLTMKTGERIGVVSKGIGRILEMARSVETFRPIPA